MYKIETHLHTTYISKCGWLGAEGIVQMYRECGYDSICVTDHYNRICFDNAEIDLKAGESRTDTLPEDAFELAELIRSRQYELIIPQWEMPPPL